MVKKTPLKGANPRPAKSREAAKSQERAEEKPQQSREDFAWQQRILNVFSQTFKEILFSDAFAATVQEVKQALFNRDFATAFGTEEYLEVYAARWSPTRALCYEACLARIRLHLDELRKEKPMEAGEGSGAASLRILSIGGGAAEIVAVGAFLSKIGASGDVNLLDSAAWGRVVSKLENGLTTPPVLPSYVSEAARTATRAIIEPSQFSARFTENDILKLDEAQLRSIIGESPLLVTLLFTLNELYTSGGLSNTTSFLLRLTAIVPAGSLLLVVDSPGSYSETTVGKQERRYPMHWLLDKVLLATIDEPVEGRRWTKLESHESIWFRLAESLNYPIPLENMRYQLHLYRAELADVGTNAKT